MTHNTAGILTLSLAAVAANYRLLACKAGSAQTAAAVKANAYGLGLAQIAPTLAAAGCNFFYVAHLDEGLALRALVPTADIAVLHGIKASDAALAHQHRLIPVICDLGNLHDWQQIAMQTGQSQPIILHIDTGMNRLGLTTPELATLTAQPELLSGLTIIMTMSHLACADEMGHPMNDQQLESLRHALACLPSTPVSFANSSGIFLGANYHFDQVRPGCALYGINPTPTSSNPMNPVATLTAPVIQLRPLIPDASVGYSAAWRSKRVGKLAVLPVGYADGFLRAAGNRGFVYFGDYAAPIVGLITIDVTDVPNHLCAVGQSAELIGSHQDVDKVAANAGTIGYEILTGLGERYQRVYTTTIDNL
jgi:alanine racemase